MGWAQEKLAALLTTSLRGGERGLESPPGCFMEIQETGIRHVEILGSFVDYVWGRRNTPTAPLERGYSIGD
jgi:hypothetical protein